MVFACLVLEVLCLMTVVFVLCVGQDEFTIIRSSTGSVADKFVVPTTKCGSSFSQVLQCSTLYPGAISHDPTKCKCACRYEFSTFGFYNGTWICLKNRAVRRQTACQFLFDGESSQNPLKVFGSFSRVILPSFSCTIDQSATRFLRCDGTFVALGQSNDFQFSPLPERIAAGKYRHTIKVATPSSRHLTGRIVSLRISCRNPSKSSCLVFKMAGEIRCPVDIKPFSSTQNPLLPLTTLPTTEILHTSTNNNISTKSPGSKKGAPNRDQSGSSSGTVAAVVVMIILLITMAAVIGFVIWKRKRGENVLFMDRLINIARKARSKPTTKPQVEESEQIYAEIPEQPTKRPETRYDAPIDGGIYSFAFNDPDSAYAPPKQQNAGSVMPVKGPIDDRGYMVPVDSSFYDVLEVPAVENDLYDNTQDNEHLSSPHRGGDGGIVVTPTAVDDNQGYMVPVDSNSNEGGVVSDVVTPASRAGDIRYVTKQRRRPPSPPRKI